MSTEEIDLARLSVVGDLRSVWSNEAHQFTPWLFGNADLLADALGIELEFEAMEHAVGGFSLDILGRDLTNDAVLIVENQLEPTDHSHLGQILTYAAGTSASTIVWITPSFREEHRQALDWLNQSTDESVNFFGVELQVVKIGDSARAPLLNVVAKPNDWQKRVRTATSGTAASGRAAIYLEFWTKFAERARSLHPEWKVRKPQPQNWVEMPTPFGSRLGYISGSFAARRRLRHELYIDSGNGERNNAIFASLMDQRTALESAYGRPLTFEELPDKRACRVGEYRDDGDVTQIERHDEYIDWFIDAGVRLRRGLGAAQLDFG